MIVTSLYRGQGLGNQLWAYSVARTVALDHGWDFGIQSPGRFKGRAFLDLDFGGPVVGVEHDGPSPDLPSGIRHYHAQARLRHPLTGADISPLDPALAVIEDDTKIEGNFESEEYIAHRRQEIAGWFASRLSADVPAGTCAISLRGGEYRHHADLLLPARYYQRAMEHVRSQDPHARFVVVTDDRRLASELLPGIPVVSHRRLPDLRRFGIHASSRAIGGDFTWLQRATHLILSNSSFSWWGAWTNLEAQIVVAPAYWARHNVSDGYWSTGTSLTRGWRWLDRHGDVRDYETSRRLWDEYRATHDWTRL